jgi:1-acyl-sn-glycerol-3-phosphate acyltransferase
MKTDEGYSVLVFPEGSRSPDSTIRRFHKGAFLIAERL